MRTVSWDQAALAFVVALSTSIVSPWRLVASPLEKAGPTAAVVSTALTTFTVTNTDDSGPGSLRDAIDRAASGDTINFTLPALPATINLNTTLTLEKNVTISGPGASSLAISGQNGVVVFIVNVGAVPEISGVTIEFGSSLLGGCIFNGGRLRLSDSAVFGCTEGTHFGGGIFNNGTLVLSNCTVSGNSASMGGGIYNFGGALVLIKSTVSGNFASNLGGGILNAGSVTMINSTVAGNSAFAGGGIWSQGRMDLSYNTFSGNSANRGGGIKTTAGEVTMKSNILANNVGTAISGTGNCDFLEGVRCIDDIGRELGGYNISDDNSCHFVCPGGDKNNTPAGLDPDGLKNNGGPTQTIALLDTSAAVDAIPLDQCTDATGAPVRIDQRGVARPKGTGCDTGAYEINHPPVARCKDVTVSAGPACLANASIDDGSSDPDGEAITRSQSPSGPYGLGTTDVTLTVTDGEGSSSTCSATVTVVDQTPPVIACPASITVGTDPGLCSATLNPGTATATDNCFEVTVAGARSDGQALISGYPQGVTTITWSATDAASNVSTCTQTVTVNDTEKPTVTTSVTQSLLWPADHGLVNVGLSASATDNCSGTPTFQVLVFSNEDDVMPTDDGFSPDAANIALGTLRLRAQRIGDGRIYLIVVKATDSSGNVGVGAATVVVPKNPGATSIDSVNAQAAAAKAFALANNGNPPPDYFVIGDGPIIGPKQ